MASTESHADIQMVTFLLGREEYAVDVMDVREIIDLTDITKVANSASHVEGVIDLRGNIVPIVSLRKRFGMPEVAAGIFSCIAVMDFSGQMAGFLIDEVSDVIRIKKSEIMPPLDAAGQPWIKGILSLDKRLVIAIDLEHLA